MELSPNCKVNVRRKSYISGAMFGSFSFINVSSGREHVDAENSMENIVEVAVAFQIMRLLYRECESSKRKISVAFLSPYLAQVKSMQQKLVNQQQSNKFVRVKVELVDEYERGGADVVIVSTVRADAGEGETVGANTNGYLTWARHCLWILGDERLHLEGGSIWKPLILVAKARECFFQADESKDLAKVVIEVKKDLHQLDELLSGEKNALFRNTIWKVLFSSMFKTSFSKIESWETKKLVLLMLLKLSSGWRPKGNATAASVSESSCFELVKEFKVKGLHLICTIDIMKEKHYTQVLKVWDILPFHEIAELVTRLEEVIGMYTQEYINRCKEKCVQRGSEYREYPIKWNTPSEIIQYKTHANPHGDEVFLDGAWGKGCVENAKVSESLILMKFYSFSTSAVDTIIYGCDGRDLGIPFELTEQEKNVVTFDKSSFILGRSGTGKTTVLTMKVFQNEQLHHIACEGLHDEVVESKEEVKKDFLHQLFVTFSPKLCYAVRQHFSEWRRLTCGGGSSSESSPTCIDDVDEMMLSENIPHHFIHLPHDVYPLIITFHRFLLMLDGTVGTSFFDRIPNARHLIKYDNKTSTSRLDVLEQFMRFKDVTYQRFCSDYWRHFNSKLKKNLDPSTVYVEIMSVIKGGLVTVKAPKGILLRDDYVSLCDGRTSIFDAKMRENIYSIFLQYEKQKLKNENFDLADLVNDLHQRIEVEGYMGDIMDYVYVDEVQDLSMRQIMLFKYVCRNVHEGFAFSGDTAQAIAKGIGFRFEDIRCLFFNEFLLGSGKGKVSKILQLTENFRTHAGILNLAQSVIDLLCHFFPLFVDALSPETSRIGGDAPVLLETDENNNAIKYIFGRNGDHSHLTTGFGSEQVVLVRDESLKKKVLSIVGENALVLTILESKGLEFQDVLLYDFFTTSSFSNEWRIIYEYMEDKDLLHSPFTSFDMQRHTVLCSELKQLYVAITRTRQRLWFCESTGFSEPIYDYWKKLGLVEIKHMSHSFANEMQIPSSEDEWRLRGIKLFHENNFRMAHMCFSKAGDKHSEKLAKAHYLRAAADNAGVMQLERVKLLEDAAELFKLTRKNKLAAECFYEIGDYETAGSIYKSESMAEKAGECFHLAKCYELAVEEYEKAGAFDQCLSACTDGKLFETGFESLGCWGECGGKELERFLHKGAHYYFSMKDSESMMKFVHSFGKEDKMRSFLMKRRCFDELISLEKEWGNFEGAAKVARQKPDPVLEADLLRMGGLNRESSLVILWHVFSKLNPLISQNVQFTEKDELLTMAISTARRDSNDVFYAFVCQEAEILSHGEAKEELLERALEFIYCYKENAFAMSSQRVKTAHEIKKIEDRICSSLISTGRLKKLILLNEVRGAFVEAAKIGDIDDCSIKAALRRRLWYIFFGSLWARGRAAWLLKDFKHKAKLLKDAKAYAMLHPESAFLQKEIHVLSDEEISLSLLWRYLTETPRERFPRIHFLISRRILDVHLNSHCKVYASTDIRVGDESIKHLEGRLMEDIVSIEGLVYFWNYWKDFICELIKWSHTCGQGFKTYEDFIYNYFGVRRYDVDNYVVLDAEAWWVKRTRSTMTRNGYLHTINARQFSSAASQYWCSELLFVADRVFGKFQNLHAYSIERNLPMHQQMEVLTSMFVMVKSLQKCNLPHDRKQASLIVDKHLQLCLNPFVQNVFHIDWKHAQSKEMICMRRNETFLTMLKEAININCRSQTGLTCGQMGRTAVIFLGYKSIGSNADIERKLKGAPGNWGALFRILVNSDKSASKIEDLAISLHDILFQEMFSAGWQSVNRDCISPACFLYLMDRLLILSFCFRGHVFTTRSACVDWLSYEEWRVSLNGCCTTSSDTMNNIHDSLALVINDLLNSPNELLEWLGRSKEPESWYPVLVLRLTLLLSLLCANSGQHYGHLSHPLGSTSLVSSLPSDFRTTLVQGLKENHLVEAIAVACEKIDNPLVIIGSKEEDFPTCPCPNARFLNVEKLEFGEKVVMEMLYPENAAAAACRRDPEAKEPEVRRVLQLISEA